MCLPKKPHGHADALRRANARNRTASPLLQREKPIRTARPPSLRPLQQLQEWRILYKAMSGQEFC
jgi:hypothetical protein